MTDTELDVLLLIAEGRHLGDYVPRYRKGARRGRGAFPMTIAERAARRLYSKGLVERDASGNWKLTERGKAATIGLRGRPCGAASNGAEPIFVSIVHQDGRERIVTCASLDECQTVIVAEAVHAKPLTYFTIVGEEAGEPLRLARWAVGRDGKLKRVPARGESKTSRERTTQLVRRN